MVASAGSDPIPLTRLRGVHACGFQLHITTLWSDLAYRRLRVQVQIISMALDSGNQGANPDVLMKQVHFEDNEEEGMEVKRKMNKAFGRYNENDVMRAIEFKRSRTLY